MPNPEDFDADYYRRFYGRRAVHSRRQIDALATAVNALAAWWRLPIRSVLDVGAGTGNWRDWFATERPKVRYHGIDVSPYACRRFGHELADLSEWVPPRRFDLVVCQSVLQYLDDRACARAIGVLGQASKGVIYLEVPTTRDRVDVLDVSRSDMDVHWRTGDWYRRRLDPLFIEVGGGVWASRSASVRFFELEVNDRSRPRTERDRGTPRGG